MALISFGSRKKKLKRNLLLPATAQPTDTAPPKEDQTLSHTVDLFRKYGRPYSMRFGSLPSSKTLHGATRVKMLQDVDADKKALRVTKQLLPDDECITQLSACQTAAKSCFDRLTHPYPLKGMRLYLFDITKIDMEKMTAEEIERELALQRETFEAEIRVHIDNYYQAVERLLGAWEGVINKASRTLRETFNAADYPSVSELRVRLRVDFGSEGLLSSTGAETQFMSREYQAAEEARVRQRFEDAVRLQEEFMLTAFSKAIDDLLDTIQRKDTGEINHFKTSRIQHVFDCFEDFQQKCLRYGIFQGSLLQEEINRAKVLMEGIGTDSTNVHRSLTDNEDVRSRAILGLRDVTNAVQQIIEKDVSTGKRRAIFMAEE